MKTSLFALLAVEVVVAASVGNHINFQKRQIPGLSKGYGKVPDPAGAAPKRVVLQSSLKVPGVKRIKVRSGPYKVPDMGSKSFTGHAGMLETYYDNSIEKPCSGQCSILRQQGGLEYPNGTNANIDSGMWLHHMVHFVTGPKRWDAVGSGNRMCLPFVGFGSSPSRSERYFVTGNERTPFNYYQPGMEGGTAFHLESQDRFTYLVELMNMNMKAQTVYITMTYDILDGPLPQGWKEVKAVYLDANSCLTSEVRPPKQNGGFSIQSKPWKPNIEGKIIDAIGHLHDGGVEVDLKATQSNSLCRMPAAYSEKPEYVFKGMDMGGEKTAKNHISSMPGCTPKDFKVQSMNKNQSWVVKGNYDYGKREGNLENGKQSEIMAIAVVLVAIAPGGGGRPT